MYESHRQNSSVSHEHVLGCLSQHRLTFKTDTSNVLTFLKKKQTNQDSCWQILNLFHTHKCHVHSHICYTGNGCYGCILGCIVRPTFLHGNLACTSSHSLWQRHVSHSHFPPRRWCFLGLQLSTLGRREALAVRAVIRTPQRERITLYVFIF